MAGPMDIWTRRADPRWIAELDLDPRTLAGVRRRVWDRRRVDATSLLMGFSRPERAQKRRRVALAGRLRLAVLEYGGPVLPVTLMILSGFGLLPIGSWTQVVVLVLVMFLCTLAMIPLVFALGRDALTPYWAAVLLEHDIAICPKCGYRPTPEGQSPTCPECGLEEWRRVGQSISTRTAGRDPATGSTVEPDRT